MSNRGRLAGVVMGYVGGDNAMDLADYIIEHGYGVVHVEKATALEQAADALSLATENSVSWEISDVLDWLYKRATEVYEEGANK